MINLPRKVKLAEIREKDWIQVKVSRSLIVLFGSRVEKLRYLGQKTARGIL